MKRLTALFLVLVLLLSGCALGNDALKPQEPAEDAGMEQDVQPVPEPEPSLMDSREPTGTRGNTWYIPNEEVEQMQLPELRQFEDAFLLSTTMNQGPEGGVQLKLISMKDGAFLAQASFPGGVYVHVQTGREGIGVCDSESGEVRIFDGQLQLTAKYELEGDGESWYLGRDLKTLYDLRYTQGVAAVELETGTETALVDNAREVMILGHSEQHVLFSYIDLESQRTFYRCLDLDTGTLSALPVEESVGWSERCGNTWLFGSKEHWGEYRLLSGGQAKTAVCMDGSLKILPQDRLLKMSLECREMTIYDLDGRFLSGCALQEGGDSYISAPPVWSSLWNGYFFLEFGGNQTGRLVFWDPEVETDGDDFLLTDDVGETEGEQTAAEELYVRAGELSDRFGVDIRIAEQCGLDYNGYTATAVSDTGWVTYGLDCIENALSVYPEGFISQLCYGDIRRIQIELVSGLTNKEGANAISNAAAFVQANGDYEVIVADVYLTSEWSYYHEIAHMIDNRLAWDASLREDALFSEEKWMELQPEGFEYAYSYTEMPDEVARYADSGYFIMEYSCRYPTEDRATMMEAAMTNSFYEFEMNPGLGPKLAYYSACIRDCFDTTGWPEEMPWEELLEPAA